MWILGLKGLRKKSELFSDSATNSSEEYFLYNFELLNVVYMLIGSCVDGNCKMKEYSTPSTTGNSGMLFFNIITYLYKFCEIFKKGFIVHSKLIVMSVSYSVVINL